MKYVFIAHSHTLFLTALGTMEALRLPPSDVVLLYTRGYRTIVSAGSCKEIIADEEFDRVSPLKSPENRCRVLPEIMRFDKIVEAWFEGDSFELFVPHLWHPFFKLLHTNRKCKRVSLVQEGAFTVEQYFHNHYPPLEKLRMRAASFIRWGTTRLYGAGWYTDGELVHQKTLDAFALYPEFFRYLKCDIHIVRWPEVKMDLQNLSDGPVFVYDGFVKHGYCSRDYYLNCCTRMAERFAGERNYLKFHPAQPAEERDVIRRLFEGKSCQVLDDTIPFELHILNDRHLTVVGMGSSLLYFAQTGGHKVHCCDTWLLDDPLFQAYQAQGVPLFHEYFSINPE